MTGPADALVIGGGPAGAAAAALLARAGRHVVLLERDTAPRDKVCGEFLSVEAVRYLTALGLDLRRLGAVPVDRVRLAGRSGRAAEARLPFAAMSLTRHALDAALLDLAAEAGAEIRRGVRVEALAPRDGLWHARPGGGEPVESRAAFLATGKHELRGWQRPPGGQNGLLGFKLHWRLAPAQDEALARSVEIALFPGGYAGLEPVEGGRANLCLLVEEPRFAAIGADWEALLAAIRAEAPLLDLRLGGATPCTLRPLAIGRLPFGHVQREAEGAAQPWRLGDQAAVAPSFTGDGVAIALHSAQLAAAAYLDGGAPAAFYRRLARDVAGPVRRALWLARLMVRAQAQSPLAVAARAAPALLRLCAAVTRLPAGSGVTSMPPH
ncbi:MAG: NAD(P)-binding protein [Alphaproteobacteria bacterium]|nr:NAD(P)-binding protein [Alphaproteobacteria bacterium]